MEETVEQKGQVSKSPNGWDFVYTKHVEYNVKIQKGTSQRVSNTTPIHAQRLFKKKKVFEKKNQAQKVHWTQHDNFFPWKSLGKSVLIIGNSPRYKNHPPAPLL